MSDGETKRVLPSERPGPASGFPALLGLIAVLAVSVMVCKSHQPPQVVPASAPPLAFSAERAYEKLTTILGDETPHPLGTVANDEVRARLLAELEALGLQVEENDHWVPGSNRWSTSVVRARNLLAEIQSTNRDLPAIVLACHYDSVGAGPGASDDGAAVGAFLEIARILKLEEPLPRPVVFLFTDGEELGLHGARGFSMYNEAANRVGMILNFEARGSSGASLMFETSRDNGWMIDQVARGLKRPVSSSAYVEVYRMMPNSSDLTVFMRRDLRGINFAYIGNPKHYHTPLDNLANLDQRSLQHHGDNALDMVRQLLIADWSGAEGHKGDAVYTDIFGRWILAWPAGWGPWFAGGFLVLFAIALCRLRRPCKWRTPQIARATTCWLLVHLVAVTLGWLCAFALLRVDETSTWWPADMAFDVAVSGLGAVIGVLLIVILFRPDPVLFFLVHCISISMAGLVLALSLPGFSYTFLLPAAGAILLWPMFLVRRPGPVALTIACLVVGGITALLCAPLVLRLPESLGLVYSPPAVAAVTAALFLPLLPLLANIRRHILYQAMLAALLAAGVCFYLAYQSPSFTPDAPQQITMTYLEEEGSEKAQLSVNPWEGEVSRTLLEELVLLGQPNPLYTPPKRAVTVESAPAGLQAPKAEVLSWNAEGAQHQARIRFTPTRTNQQMLIGIPDKHGLKKIHAIDKDLNIPTGRKDGHKWLRFRGVSQEGIEIELTWEGPGTLPLVLAGFTPGLPSHLESLRERRVNLPACTAHMGDESIAVKRVTLQSPVF